MSDEPWSFEFFAKPVKPASDGVCVFRLRDAGNHKTYIHTQESIDGVLFLVTLEYGQDGSLMRKTMTRGDLVRG